ncbi:hypothetical protein GCM10023185_10430 [Hymenobacter saemangeumensis]|uniref:ABC transporter ATPase n=1 Tax=Hymenobacter saemangeumensis TaxID=1084522 RepID=A0ABP8I555_9BACT
MYVAFDQLPDQARVWIYQASRPLAAEELIAVLPQLAQFAEEWTSHGRHLRASAEFLHRQFLVIGLDESLAGASGCSIDSSVHFVRQLEQQLGAQLLEKSHLGFLHEGKVWLLDRRELRAAIADGRVQPDTFYFDNTVATKGELAEKWPAPVEKTWLARYFTGQEKK